MFLDVEEEIPNIESLGHILSCRSTSSGGRANCATRGSSDLASNIWNLCGSSIGCRSDSFGYWGVVSMLARFYVLFSSAVRCGRVGFGGCSYWVVAVLSLGFSVSCGFELGLISAGPSSLENWLRCPWTADSGLEWGECGNGPWSRWEWIGGGRENAKGGLPKTEPLPIVSRSCTSCNFEYLHDCEK